MSAQRPNFFRRASDFLKHKDHSESAVSSAIQSPEPSRPSSPVDGITSEKKQKTRQWSFGRHLTDEEKKQRRDSQDAKDREYFEAARKYTNARRKSHGAGIGFEGGWQ